MFKSNISLPTVDDKHSFTRFRNELDLLITSIESLEPPSYWYSISDNGKGSLYELFRLEDCVFLFIMRNDVLSVKTKLIERCHFLLKRINLFLF